MVVSDLGNSLTRAAALVGAFFILRAIISLIWGTWTVFFRPPKNLNRYGSWAAVTGATDGIGKGFVKALAKKKINILLISRSIDKLTELATEIQTKYGVQTRTVAVDFTDPDLGDKIKMVEEAAADLEVGILINNVGMSYPFAQFFHELDSTTVTNIIRLNVEVTTKMTYIFLPKMVSRKRGAIINIGSGAASVLPSDPLYAVYAGTKGFVDQFSRTLYVEYKNKGIDVQCQAPLYVSTKLSKIRYASLTCPSPDVYAKYGLKWIGYEPRCTPYWVHSIIWWLVWVLPESIMDHIRLIQNLGIRKRGLDKELRKKQS